VHAAAALTGVPSSNDPPHHYRGLPSAFDGKSQVRSRVEHKDDLRLAILIEIRDRRIATNVRLIWVSWRSRTNVTYALSPPFFTMTVLPVTSVTRPPLLTEAHL
jgi:hypothetical protein